MANNRVLFHSIDVPSTTPDRIVFTYNIYNRKFNTNNYTPALTQNRVSVKEITDFLGAVNAPFREWDEEFFSKYYLTDRYFLCIFCFLIPPLLLPFLIWKCFVEKAAEKKREEVTQRAINIVKVGGERFSEKGVFWTIPTAFPRYIELWTNRQNSPQPAFVGIQMVPVVLQPQIVSRHDQISPAMPNQEGFVYVNMPAQQMYS